MGGYNGLLTTSVGVSGSDPIRAKEGTPGALGDWCGDAKNDSVSTAGDRGDKEGSSIGGRIDSGDASGLILSSDL